jgi:CheY-like chemotaxis protein
MAAKVLVVEDDVFLIKAYVAKLGNSGFELQTAKDGEEAISILQNYMPDVILLDLVMPRKDGFSTLEDIKKDDKLKNIPVIVTSNLAQKEDIDRVRALGANEVVTKSDMSMEDLVKLINKTIGA